VPTRDHHVHDDIVRRNVRDELRGFPDAVRVRTNEALRMKTATILIALLLVPSAGIGIALGAGPDQGYDDFRTESSPAIELLPRSTGAVLAQCDPGERAAGGYYEVAGDHEDVAVLGSRRVKVSDDVSGWTVTFQNRTGTTQFVTTRTVCETL
jgi:hypothetical protein